jgi:hypothetical protein
MRKMQHYWISQNWRNSMITEKEKAFRQGYIAACEWFLEQKPTRTQVKEKVKWNKEMLEE